MQVKRATLEMTLAKVPPFPNPDAALEQVSTPAGLATDVLFEAFARGDIGGRVVFDLGCGTGILAIGAGLLGGMPVFGFDTDADALELARDAARALGASTVTFETSDVRDVPPGADTVISNPPFGAQSRHADRPFLEAAARVGGVCYTFHNGPTEDWARIYIQETLGGRVTNAWPYRFPIPAMRAHHEKPVRDVPVVVLRWLAPSSGSSVA